MKKKQLYSIKPGKTRWNSVQPGATQSKSFPLPMPPSHSESRPNWMAAECKSLSTTDAGLNEVGRHGIEKGFAASPS